MATVTMDERTIEYASTAITSLTLDPFNSSGNLYVSKWKLFFLVFHKNFIFIYSYSK